MIRKAQPADLDAVVRCYECAKAFMRATGNTVQWLSDYPGRIDAEADLAAGNLYVVEHNSQITGAFTFILGEEPTYAVITNGHWTSQEPYGTIHRVASNGASRGVFAECVEFCRGRIGHLRIDTHASNMKMLELIVRAGFRECGTIIVDDGTPRRAFEWRNGR